MIMNQDSREVVLKGNDHNAVASSADKFRKGVDGGAAQGVVGDNGTVNQSTTNQSTTKQSTTKQSTAKQSTTVDAPSTNKAPQIVYLEPHVESMEVTIITGNQKNNYNNCYGGQCCRQYDEQCGDDEGDDFFDDDLDDDFSSPTPCAECDHIDECADERSAAVAADESAVVAADDNAPQCSERPVSMIPFDLIVKEIANIGQVSLSVAISVIEAYLALCVAFDADVPVMFDKNKFDLCCVGSSNPDWLKRVYRAAHRLANDETHLTDKEKRIIDRRDDATAETDKSVTPVNASVPSEPASDDPLSIQQFLADMPEPMKGIVECMAQNSKGLKIYRLDVVDEGDGESGDPASNHMTAHNADTIREVKTHE